MHKDVFICTHCELLLLTLTTVSSSVKSKELLGMSGLGCLPCHACDNVTGPCGELLLLSVTALLCRLCSLT